tara:strand:- start:79 stop:264 length:186 start_codon:yes stop_codon:yes gene_type:complete
MRHEKGISFNARTQSGNLTRFAPLAYCFFEIRGIYENGSPSNYQKIFSSDYQSVQIEILAR